MQLINASRLPLKELNQSLTVYGDFNVLKPSFDLFEAFKDIGLYEKYYKLFSLVIDNKSTGGQLLVRDHFGQKPLFYCINNHELIVADNIPDIIKALQTVPELLKSVCDNLLSARKVYCDETIYKGIYRVEPGHIVEISKTGTINKKPFWKLDAESAPFVLKNESDYLSEFARLLKEATQNAIGVEASIASEFSAGIDSTAIYNEAVQLGVKPFLFVHEHPKDSDYEKKYNDSYEKAFLERFRPDSIHEIHEIHADDFDAYASLIEDIDRVGEPSGYLFPTFMSPLYEQVQKTGAKILLSGFGGDQGVSFPASPRFLLATLMNDGCIKNAWQITKSMSKNPLKRLLYMLAATSKTVKQVNNKYSGLKASILNQFRREEDRKNQTLHPYYSEYFKTHRHLLVSFLQGEFSHEIRARIEASHIVAKNFGFEYRYPLLYPPLLEFFLRLPVSMLRKGGMGRYLMRLYLADYAGLPEYMHYQKCEGRAILPATVSRFKEVLTKGYFKDEAQESFSKFTSKDKNKISNIDINSVVVSCMLDKCQKLKINQPMESHNGYEKPCPSSV